MKKISILFTLEIFLIACAPAHSGDLVNRNAYYAGENEP